MDKEITWLLKDKYNFSDSQINDFLLNSRLLPPTSRGRNDDRDIYAKIQKDLKRLKTGEPINYIIGWQDFLDCKIDLSFKPLIPRVETEFWVKNVIDVLTTKHFSTLVENYNLSILDLCCGSGCIGISILKHILHSKVVFVDIDSNFIEQTKLNLEINQIPENRYKIIKSDLFANINEKFDYIFTNPPYVSKNDTVPKSLKFEPEVALFANNNGMEIIEKILNNFQGYLNPDGQLFLEFGQEQQVGIKKILKKNNLLTYFFNNDQYGKKRYLQVSL